MKLTVLLMVVGLTYVTAGTYAQNATLSVSATNETLENVLKQIEEQSEFLFFYNNDEINKNEKISLDEDNSTIFEILDEISEHIGISYSVKDRHIVLTGKNEKTGLPGVTQQVGRTITGIVVDNYGDPVIGANVVVKGTSNGTITNLDGEFSLDVPENAVLQISYIGYLNQEISVGNRNTFQITLAEDTQTLDEVVVVGYGTMKKKDLTGAIATVKLDDSPIATVSTVSHALAGKAAGLQVNMETAQPGGATSFRIRGAGSSKEAGNDPLIIIDGFPINNVSEETQKKYNEVGRYRSGNKDNILGSINPNDIESIEILKDASSTAIYGSRAGNGVVIITTKKGRTGAPQVRYSGTASVQQIARNYDMMDARDFMIQSNRYFKEEWLRSTGQAPYGNNSVSGGEFNGRYTDADIANPVNNTNWFDEITRMGYQTQHNVSITGGTDHTKYLISGNYFKQEGIVKNNDMDRFTGRINLEQTLSKYVKTGINLTVSRNNYNDVPLGVGQNENASILVSAAQFSPILAIKDNDGEYVLNTEAAFLPNPVSLLEITNKNVRERVLGTAYIEVEPIQGLKLKGNFGVDRNYNKVKVYLPKTTLYGQKEGGKANLRQIDNSDYLVELTANYNKQIKEHSFNILAGYSFQSFHYELLEAGNNQFLTDGFLYNNIGAGAAAKPGVASAYTKDEMGSYFGRINYTYKDRYLFTATLRADGASNFAKNNRWGYFPSVAAGWRFTEEDFMQSYADILSNGKLRISYGETGNSNIGNRAISYYEVTEKNNEFGGTESKGVYIKQVGNPDIKWETTKEWNFGVDLGFLNNRINVTAEYFRKVISGQLGERNLLMYHQVEKIADNLGETQSKGFELTINTRNYNTRDFSWNTDLTFSFYRDKWKKRDDTWKPAAYSIYNAPLRGQYGYVSDGLVQVGEEVKHMPGALPGQVKLKDLNNDGKLDDEDKVFYGNEDPGYLLGFNNTFQWKNFDLNIYFYGQFNKLSYGSYKDLWLTGRDNMTGIVNMYRGYNMPVTAKEVWTHDNPTATRPGYFQDRSSWGIGDYYNQKIWFIRCRNITLGYNVPVNPSKKIVSNVRVYVDVNNPFVLTPYDGLDPETDSSVWAYPNVRSYSLGLEVTF